MATQKLIEFWFDFASTYSYPAAMRIEDLAARSDCRIVWQPFVLGVIFEKQGWHDSPFNIYPVKGNYMWRDLERMCAALAIPFRKPSRFPRNGLAAARIVCANEGTPWIGEFTRKVYTANFAHDLDIAKREVLCSCLEGLVNDPAAVFEAAHGKDAKSRLRANTERAMALGIFGAPSFIAAGELFWGNDRLETALAWQSQD
jgi:2-hydroxychromene-2-carboxylate isomerase